MKVMVKRDSATNIVVDCGEGPQAHEKLASLVLVHGLANITNEDGSTIAEPAKAKLATPAKSAKKPAKAHAKAKKRSR